MTGSGTLIDPYLVSTKEDLIDLPINSYVVQVADIDLSGEETIVVKKGYKYDGGGFELKDFDGLRFRIEFDDVINTSFKNIVANNLGVKSINTTNIELDGIYLSEAVYVIDSTKIENCKIKNVLSKLSKSPLIEGGCFIRSLIIENLSIEDFYLEGTSSSISLINSSTVSGASIKIKVKNLTGIIYLSNGYKVKSTYIELIEGSETTTDFAPLKGSQLRDITLQDIHVVGEIDGGQNVSGVVSGIESGKMERCISELNIKAFSSAGGLVYYLRDISTFKLEISQCYALMNSITRKTGTSTKFGRLFGDFNVVGDGGGTIIEDTYALSSMKIYGSY